LSSYLKQHLLDNQISLLDMEVFSSWVRRPREVNKHTTADAPETGLWHKALGQPGQPHIQSDTTTNKTKDIVSAQTAINQTYKKELLNLNSC